MADACENLSLLSGHKFGDVNAIKSTSIDHSRAYLRDARLKLTDVRLLLVQVTLAIQVLKMSLIYSNH
jgi:hypothetical protein